MLEFGACPHCKLEISPERKNQTPVVCNHCGFTPNTAKTERSFERKSMYFSLGASVFVVLSYIQIANWDKAWLSILPIGAKETLGMASPSDYEDKAQICLDLKKYDCTEDAYLHVAAAQPAQFARAGHFQMQRSKFNEAAQSYYKFFTGGGQDLESSYNYAKALAQLGQVDTAIKYFDQVLAAKPETLQVTVVQNYVRLLVDHQRYDQAKALIERIRKNGGEFAASFMDPEYKKIKDLNSRTASAE